MTQANNPNNQSETTQHGQDYDVFGKILNKTQVDEICNQTALDLVDLEGGAHDDDWLLVDEDERLENLMDNIEQSLFAFNTGFLSGFTGLPSSVFEGLAGAHEDSNEAILALVEKCGPGRQVDNFESFCNMAAAADGHGHFLNPYDGSEEEIDGGDELLFLYRVN